MIRRIEAFLAPSDRLAALIDPLFRVSTSLIFIVGGLGHFGRHDDMLARIEESPWRDAVYVVGNPSWLLWLSGAVFIVFGLSLAVGYAMRLSALLLIATLIPITVSVHWAPGHVGPFLKNVAILGALLYFYAHGAGRYALNSGDRPAP